jgi:hypothetical protein
MHSWTRTAWPVRARRQRLSADGPMGSPVPAQMWNGVSPVPAQMRAGTSPVPAQMWKGVPSPGTDVERGEPSPGTDVERGEPSPGADVERGELSPGADVEKGELSPGADVERGELSPGADVEGDEPSPGADVERDEPSPGADVERGEPSTGADVERGEPSPGAGVEGMSPVLAQMWIDLTRLVPAQMCLWKDWAHPPPTSATGLGSPLPTSAPGLDGLTPANICAGTSWPHPRPHLRRDWAHPCHICTATGLTPPTSAPGLGVPAESCPTVHRGLTPRSAASSERLASSAGSAADRSTCSTPIWHVTAGSVARCTELQHGAPRCSGAAP